MLGGEVYFVDKFNVLLACNYTGCITKVAVSTELIDGPVVSGKQ